MARTFLYKSIFTSLSIFFKILLTFDPSQYYKDYENTKISDIGFIFSINTLNYKITISALN